MTLGGAAGSPIAGQVLDASGFRLYGLIGLVVIVAALVVAVMLLPAQQPVSDAQPQGRGTTLAVARRPVVQLLMGLRFLPTLFYGMATVLAPLMINELAGAKTTVALYGAASLVIASGAQLLAGRAADRYGNRWPTLIGYATLIVASLGLALFAGQLWGVFFFGILGIAAAWALATLFFVLVSDCLLYTSRCV